MAETDREMSSVFTVGEKLFRGTVGSLPSSLTLMDGMDAGGMDASGMDAGGGGGGGGC